MSLDIPTFIQLSLLVPKILWEAVNSGTYISSSGFCHPVEPSSLRTPITLYEVPAIRMSWLRISLTDFLSSPGTFDPNTTTFFLPI